MMVESAHIREGVYPRHLGLESSVISSRQLLGERVRSPASRLSGRCFRPLAADGGTAWMYPKVDPEPPASFRSLTTPHFGNIVSGVFTPVLE
jgi:hypothetical protein